MNKKQSSRREFGKKVFLSSVTLFVQQCTSKNAIVSSEKNLSANKVIKEGKPGARLSNFKRGLYKDRRFTQAQYMYNNQGKIINTNIDIDIEKLNNGFIHDNNWKNMKGHSFKQWKVGNADFRKEPLENIAIPENFSGKQIAITIYYFNSSGIIKEQYQEFLQL